MIFHFHRVLHVEREREGEKGSESDREIGWKKKRKSNLIKNC